MTVWRPPPSIRVKALGLHRRDGKLLAFDVLDDRGRLKGVRPLGGGVAFGESARAAVVREFQEELGIEVEVLGEPVVIESIYSHEGSEGHEVLFLFEVRFPAEAFEGLDCLTFAESDGTPCLARWHDLDALDLPGGPALYPSGLKRHLTDAT